MRPLGQRARAPHHTAPLGVSGRHRHAGAVEPQVDAVHVVGRVDVEADGADDERGRGQDAAVGQAVDLNIGVGEGAQRVEPVQPGGGVAHGEGDGHAREAPPAAHGRATTAERPPTCRGGAEAPGITMARPAPPRPPRLDARNPA